MITKRVTCAVMLREGRVLLARRAAGQKNAGMWEFPGGKVEPGESDAACLEREIREEFGVTGKAGSHLCDSLHTYEAMGMRIQLCAYLFAPDSFEFSLRVHDAVAFLPPEELAAAGLSPADIPIADAVYRYMRNSHS